MYYTREQHKKFLDKELTAISEVYLKQLKSRATALLANNEVYVTQFMKLDIRKGDVSQEDNSVTGSGHLILKFKKNKGIPRKNEYFTAVVLEKDMCLPRNWGGISWGELRHRHQVEFSEVHCVWQGRANEKGFLLCGFSGLSIEMAQYLEKKEGCVIVLGPQEPPMKYYQNLINLVSNGDNSMPAKSILDFDPMGITWNPQRINSNRDQVEGILGTLEVSPRLIFQGPPGTGKTFLMAELVSVLLDKGKSVLVTAMTNRALMELIQKESLRHWREQGKVMKTNVSSDEKIDCENIVPIDSKEITCISGHLTLSTFYNSSGWADNCYMVQPFDYVIMDEASQAMFAMIAACANLGKKIIWIGDQNQMQPIVQLSDETLQRNDYYMLSNGFQTLCNNFDYKSFMLTETHRLLPRAAALTSLFYHTPIKSVADFDYEFTNIKEVFIPTEGGCSLMLIDMPNGEKADLSACQHTVDIVDRLLSYDHSLNVAILSKFRASVRMLQNCFISKFGNKNNVTIDTVERVQGMTCDVCVYFIPNTMMVMSLDKPLFNVATSRAKQFTVIVADKSIMNAMCEKSVHTFLEFIKSGTIPEIKETPTEPQIIEGNGYRLVVKGKMDLSKLQTPKQKAVISQTKKNIYIIDTNVFVKCPEILSKIDKSAQIVLSAKVIDELDHLKITLNSVDKSNVEKALRNINKAMSNNNVSIVLSNDNLLPKDFNKNSPDNKILSVALKYKDENPILLTSDNGLQVKAKGLRMATLSLRDFLEH